MTSSLLSQKIKYVVGQPTDKKEETFQRPNKMINFVITNLIFISSVPLTNTHANMENESPFFIRLLKSSKFRKHSLTNK